MYTARSVTEVVVVVGVVTVVADYILLYMRWSAVAVADDETLEIGY